MNSMLIKTIFLSTFIALLALTLTKAWEYSKLDIAVNILRIKEIMVLYILSPV